MNAKPMTAQSRRPRVLARTASRGRTEVLPRAVAAVAGHTAATCYGVMGLAARGLRDGVGQLLRRESAHRGVDVREVGGDLVIDLYVIVQYGTRITEVARNLQSAVKFEIERWLQVPVAEVNIHVQGVHDDVSER